MDQQEAAAIITAALGLARERVTGDTLGAKTARAAVIEALRDQVALHGRGLAPPPGRAQLLEAIGDGDPQVRLALRAWPE